MVARHSLGFSVEHRSRTGVPRQARGGDRSSASHKPYRRTAAGNRRIAASAPGPARGPGVDGRNVQAGLSDTKVFGVRCAPAACVRRLRVPGCPAPISTTIYPGWPVTGSVAQRASSMHMRRLLMRVPARPPGDSAFPQDRVDVARRRPAGMSELFDCRTKAAERFAESAVHACTWGSQQDADL